MSREEGTEGTKGSEERKGSLKHKHQFSTTDIKDGKAIVKEEFIIEGDKGIMFKYYSKEGDSKTKITGRSNPDDDSFSVRTSQNGKEPTEENMSRADLIKMLSKDKNLKFVTDYLKRSQSE